MTRLFQPSVGEIGATPYVPTEQVDTSTSSAISAIGGTMWEAYKGKQVANFVNQEAELVPNVQVEGIGPEATISRIDTPPSTADMGLRQLERAVAQGHYTQEQAEIIAESRAKSFINRLPGISGAIKQELALFKLGKNRRDAIGSGGDSLDKYDPSIAAAKGQAQAITELTKQASMLGVSVGQLIDYNQQEQRLKQQTANLELQAKQSAAYARNAADYTATLQSDATHGLHGDIFQINSRIASGEINEATGMLEWSAAVQARRQAMRDTLLAYRQDAPPEQQGEITTAFNASLQEFETYVKELEPLTIQEQQKLLMQAQTTADSLNMSSESLIRISSALKALGFQEAIPAFHSAWLAADEQGKKLILSQYGLDPAQYLGVKNSTARTFRQIITQPIDSIQGNPDPASRSYESMISFRLLDQQQPSASTDIPNVDTSKPVGQSPLPKVVTRLIANAGVDNPGQIWEAIAERPTNYLTTAVGGDSEAADYLGEMYKAQLLELIQSHVTALNLANAIAKPKSVGQFGFQSGEISGYTGGRSINDTRNKIIYMIKSALKNPGLFEDPTQFIQSLSEEVGLDITDILQEVGIETDQGKKRSEVNAEVDIDKLYKAVASVEVRGEADPFIRTRVRTAPGGSSAYGPVQITGSLAKGMLRQYGNQFTEEEQQYLNKFIQQADAFLLFGNEPDKEGYDPKYDYGGAGDLNTPDDKSMYEQVAKKFMRILLEKEAGGDVQEFLRKWRGEGIEDWYVAGFNRSMGNA